MARVVMMHVAFVIGSAAAGPACQDLIGGKVDARTVLGVLWCTEITNAADCDNAYFVHEDTVRICAFNQEKPNACWQDQDVKDSQTPWAPCQTPSTPPSPPPSAPPSPPDSVGATGDPIAEGPDGAQSRYFLPVDSPTSLIKQPPGVEVVARGGPATNKEAVQRGEWMTVIELLLDSVLLLTATLRPIAGLLPANLQGLDKLPGGGHHAGLTSLNLTIGSESKVIQEPGSFELRAKAALEMPVSVVVSQLADKRIGTGHVETATIKVGESFELVLWTAKAHKFASEYDQIAHAHLDFQLLKYDPKTVTGPLPEMWGLQPLTSATKAMLSPNAVA